MDMECMLSRTVGEVFELGPGIPIFLYDKSREFTEEPPFIPAELSRIQLATKSGGIPFGSGFAVSWNNGTQERIVDSSFRVWASSKHLPNPANPKT